MMQLLVQELVGGNDARAHAAERLAPLAEAAGTERPCFVAGHDDPPVVPADKQKARLLAALLEDELRFRVSRNCREAAAREQAPDTLTMAEPSDEIDVRVLARQAADVEVECPSAP